jgi:hypothetical protein
MSFPGYPDTFDPGWWRVVDVTPPLQEPVSLADAKAFARIEFDDDDAIVAGLISMAREYCEIATARTIAARVRAVYFMGFPWGGGYYNRMIRSMGPNPWWLPTNQGIVQIRQPPLQGVNLIQYAAPNVAPTDYLEILGSQILVSTGTPGRVQPTYGAVWPLANPQIDAVVFTFTAGYGLTTPLVSTYGGPPSQTILIYGVPTGGTFTLTFQGQTTSALAYNATAAQVQTALQALETIGTNNVTCSGGPFPTIPIFIVWAGALQTASYQPQITITPALTGDPAAAAIAGPPPALPRGLAIAIKQIVADSYENREANLDIELKVNPAAERALMPAMWGTYV